MSIRKRLILSNIAMILIPVISLFLIEIVIGYILFVAFQGNMDEVNVNSFMQIRFTAIGGVLILTNGLLTYYVSKSIIQPISKLSTAARRISTGDLEYSVKSDKKDELGELSNNFENMRLQLKEAEKAQEAYEKNRQELIAQISHDLKTPLTSIKGYVQGIQDGVANTPEKLEHYTETIYQTANDMNELIDELFLYSKLDLQQEKLQFEEVDLYAFFVDFIEEMSFFLEKKNGKANLSAEKAENYIIHADREKIRRVVLNIIQNSMKYMKEEPQKIQVSLENSENEVVVEIKDNGSGIDEADIPFIFNNFYRTDASRNSETGGSGLGLSIVKKIIQAHGGTVWAKSQLHKGSSIYFTLKKAV
ncbi:sensor histidine kinase [Tetragenococcus halophilus]|uniref:sensor histidine kinase n=1 Tax=Tetragenococcus halophilus TaxID=51669 RepID=UPI00209B535B|nr:HAMP domain-containing sensor histidine kinase [Tetragenococcus halophilus]MCO8288661.1 HAMP domain-containing histidine kinase [Tetragenococcus halophilus]MDN6723423.1 HAMP domain-containing histidine kinase [Tetragenococcus halophilus]